MAQVWKVRLPDGRTLVPGDWTSAVPLYSTVEISTGAFTVQTAFSYGLGQAVPGSVGPRQSNLADTNLQGEGAQLPQNEELIIYVIGIEVFKIGLAGGSNGVGADQIPATDAPDVELMNMLRLQRDINVTLRIAAVKNYTGSPLSYWPSGTGVQQYNSGARSAVSNGASGYVAGNNGSTDADQGRTLASPLYVAGGEAFALDISAGPGQVNGLDLAATGRMRLRCYLDGYRRRPVA